MEREQIKGYIAARAAKEIKNGDIVNLGIGFPTCVPQYLPEDVKVMLQAENGMIGTGVVTEENKDPLYLVDAGGAPAAVGPHGSFFDSAASFAFIRGGHVDISVLGALEVDSQGNLANWMIPGKKVPGMGGAMDLVVGARKVIVTMEHTARGAHKILNKCRLPYTAINCVDLIITEMAVIEVRPEGLVLTEYNPEFSVDEIQAATEAPLIISPELKPIAV